MNTHSSHPSPALSAMTDEELHQLVLGGGEAAARELTGRYNQRLFRMAWSVLKDRSDAEEAVQDAWVKAFTGKAVFDGRSAYATWLTRIVLNQALDRRRTTQRRTQLLEQEGIAEMDDYRRRLAEAPITNGSPEEALSRAELARRLEKAVALISDPFRTVLVLRDIEGMSTEETAGALDIPPQTVKTRLLRGRRQMQEILEPDMQAALHDAFPFLGEHCAALTEAVIARLRQHWAQ